VPGHSSNAASTKLNLGPGLTKSAEETPLKQSTHSIEYLGWVNNIDQHPGLGGPPTFVTSADAAPQVDSTARPTCWQGHASDSARSPLACLTGASCMAEAVRRCGFPHRQTFLSGRVVCLDLDYICCLAGLLGIRVASWVDSGTQMDPPKVT
jgi:hypothetical protein